MTVPSTPQEFMFGCLKFRGDAKSLDIAVMHQQVLWIHEALKVVVSQLGEQIISRKSLNTKSSCNSDQSIISSIAVDPTGSVGPPGYVERLNSNLSCMSP
ncbi:unnamed protein product [Prorocentrum cordatum]|uniref:Uncharacterized protein n=1 Tax=Prorocentrum cordatum TaxID=2364126 RepID=A0ABN9VBN7_9DINO|nr:unnamed protein product [Polarella glacialis]